MDGTAAIDMLADNRHNVQRLENLHSKLLNQVSIKWMS